MIKYLVFMGVSGSGKTSVAGRLAELLGAQTLIEADDLHPPANKQKMGAGIPLNDEDRMPWLDTMNGALKAAAGDLVVATCSALRQIYRERLARGLEGQILFILLDSPREAIEARLAGRKHEYMPATLLTSQLKTLERPIPGEPAVIVSVVGTVDDTVAAVIDAVAPQVPAVVRLSAWSSDKTSNSKSGTGT
jgi:gluconokinase